MTAVITTISFTMEHEPEQEHTHVVGTIPTSTDEVRIDFSRRLGARWQNDEKFELELQYARTAIYLLSQQDLGTPEFRPADLRIPLNLVIDKAITEAQAHENWPVQAVELLDADVTHRFKEGVEQLVYVGTYTARITQTRP